MKRVAIVGYGFMGRAHFGAWKKCPHAKVVAVCVRHPEQLRTKVTGNVKGAADNSALPADVRVFTDFSAMLDAGGIDIVDLTVPTPRHADMAVAALEAGCDVLCEKPMALSLAEADRMLAAAKRTGRVLLVAQCVRFFPEYAALAKLVRRGTYGRVIAADFSRFMSAPKWSPKGGAWLLDERKSGGLFVDAHIHDADYVLSVFGEPSRFVVRSHRGAGGYVDHLVANYSYTDGKIVTATCSFAASASLKWDAFAHVFFERATVYLAGGRLTIYPEQGKAFRPRLSRRSGYEEEVRYFLALTEGRRAGALTAEAARASLRLVLAERKASQFSTGRLTLD